LRTSHTTIAAAQASSACTASEWGQEGACEGAVVEPVVIDFSP
jgi:hypothetical protein